MGPVDEVIMVQAMDPSVADSESMVNLNLHHKSEGNAMIYIAWRKPHFQAALWRSPECAMFFSLQDETWFQARESMHFLMMRAFLNYVETGDPGRVCTLEQARHVMEVVDAGRRSWEERGVVRIS